MSTDLVTQKQSAIVADATAYIDQWLDHCSNADWASDATLAAHRKGMAFFIAWLRETGNTGAVTPKVVVQFKSALSKGYKVTVKDRATGEDKRVAHGPYSAQTVNLRLSAVRSFYRWCVITGRLAVSPAESVKGAKRPKSRQHKRDELASAQMLGVHDTCDAGTLAGARDAAILALMSYCALRTIEVQRANIGDFRADGNCLTLTVWGKGRLEDDKETAVIPRSQEHVIWEWLAHGLTFEHHRDGDPLLVSLSNRNWGGRMTTQAIRQMVKDRYRLAGVVGRRKTTHSLRHNAITNLIRHGGTSLQARTLTRHSSLDTTLGYYHEVARTENPPEDLINYG
jgi:integrase/recombinase XerC